jgi:hypothetical protein
MIRKHDNGGNVEWVFLLRFLERLPQRIDVIDKLMSVADPADCG